MLRQLAARTVQRFYNGQWFLSRAENESGRTRRRELLKRFRKIDHAISCQHTEREMLVLVDFLFGLSQPGCVVECGCYQGGSSAKLSIAAKMMNCKLHVCDSFAGLPETAGRDGQFQDIDGRTINYARGQYSAGLELVKANVERFGEPDVVEYLPGFFSDTLPMLSVEPILVFSDADLISSTRDVIRCLWPRLLPGGRIYSHDLNMPELVRGITDCDFWLNEVGCPPPPIFGAGYGVGYGAGGIGYFEKLERDVASA
jgi:O-methyltransferase